MTYRHEAVVDGKSAAEMSFRLLQLETPTGLNAVTYNN